MDFVQGSDEKTFFKRSSTYAILGNVMGDRYEVTVDNYDKSGK